MAMKIWFLTPDGHVHNETPNQYPRHWLTTFTLDDLLMGDRVLSHDSLLTFATQIEHDYLRDTIVTRIYGNGFLNPPTEEHESPVAEWVDAWRSGSAMIAA